MPVRGQLEEDRTHRQFPADVEATAGLRREGSGEVVVGALDGQQVDVVSAGGEDVLDRFAVHQGEDRAQGLMPVGHHAEGLVPGPSRPGHPGG